MISAALRLLLIYGAIWWCARQWPVGREWFVQLVEQLQGASGAYSPLATLLVLALALTLVRVLTLPFWVAPVPLDRLTDQPPQASLHQLQCLQLSSHQLSSHHPSSVAPATVTPPSESSVVAPTASTLPKSVGHAIDQTRQLPLWPPSHQG